MAATNAAFEEEMSRIRLRDRSNSMESVRTVIRRRRSSSTDAQVGNRAEAEARRPSKLGYRQESEEEPDDENGFGYALSRTASRLG